MDTNKMRELKELAEAAGSYEWYAAGDLRYCDDKTGETHGLHHDDSRFIAAASPATVLALLEEIERLKERNVYWIDQANTIAVDRNSIRNERDQLKAENEDYRSGQDRYEQIIDDLKAENEALRKDAERYRAIRDEIPHADLGRAILDAQTADEYDAAVDAAMAKEAIHG